MKIMRLPIVLIGLIGSVSLKSDMNNAMAGENAFLAKDFFKNVVGMDEKSFMTQFGWKAEKDGATCGRLTKLPANEREYSAWQRGWIQKFPRRQAIFTGQYYFETVDQLNQKIQEREPLAGHGTFTVLLHNLKHDQEIVTEVTKLQADPENNDAVFQIASTMYGPLEGATASADVLLTSMVESAAQGEWATAGTAGATIYRKYFMPRYFYLLDNFNKGVHKDNVGIFTHENVTVTSWCQKDMYKRENAVMRSVPLRFNQKVTQIFNAACDLRRIKSQLQPGDALYARTVLMGMYEGTLKKAYLLGKKKVYLTLLGGGVFGNDIRWIADALDNKAMIDFIKKSGLEVYLIYRPERNYGFPWQPRTFEKDMSFLKRMFSISDKINGTNTINTRMSELMLKGYTKYIEDSYLAT